MAVSPDLTKRWEADRDFRTAVLDDPSGAAQRAGFTSLSADDRAFLANRARAGQVLRAASDLHAAVRDTWSDLSAEDITYVRAAVPGLREGDILQRLETSLVWCGLPPTTTA